MTGAALPDDLAPARGTFLVAGPRLLDPNFMHAVVLLVEHAPQGSFGVIVNRPGAVRVGDLESDAELLEGREDLVWFGGPVSLERLQVIHRVGSSVPGSLHVVEGVHLGGDPAVLKSAIEGRKDASDLVRFVVGYSGWGEGQLETEIREGAWVVCPASERYVFDPRPDTVWRRVLRARGAPYDALVHLPPDPTWN